MIFIDTEAPFQSQPLVQAYVAIGDEEDELPTLWQEIAVFGGDIFLTYEEGVIHTFLSLELQEQLSPGQFIFIKVIAIGELQTLKSIRMD